MTVRTSKLVLLAVLLVLVLAPATAFAALAKVGPINPYNAAAHTGNGFPRYYVDTNGVAVDLPVPPFGDGVGATSPTMIFAPPTDPPFNQFSADIGFDVECFYFLVQPDSAPLAKGGGGFDPVEWGSVGRFNVRIGLEAGFATPFPAGAPVDGQQGVFQRIRFNWFAVPAAGTYLFKHPYGVETITITSGDLQANGGQGMRYTVDTPLATNIPPFNFTLALGDNPQFPGKIGPFLFQLNPPPVITPPVPPAPPIPPGFNKPTDWLGDGVTPATFTGSPLNPPFNQFRLEAWDTATGAPLDIFTNPVTLAPTNIVETTLANIAGHRLHLPTIAGIIDLLLLD